MIRVSGWEKFQHYGKAKPPWIKLYRDVLGQYELMYRLDPSERWVLMGLWMLAAECGNQIPADVAFLQHRLRADVTEDLIQKLQALGLLEDGAPPRDGLEGVYTKTETERETEKETDIKTSGKTKQRDDVENLAGEGAGAPSRAPNARPNVAATTSGVSSSEPSPANRIPEYTEAALLYEAEQVLGLGALNSADKRANRSIMRHWLYKSNPIRSEEVYAAIYGLRLMVDQRRSEVADWLKPGHPISLKALNNTHTLYDQGDGKAKRVLWDVAVEAYQRDDTPTHSKRGGGPKPLSITINEGVA